MSYKVLARKWRPQHFRDMLGQESVLRALTNALETDRLHHAYLFTGMRGVGKTTIARIFAKCLNCESNGVTSDPCGQCSACRDIESGRFFDLIEVDAASRTKVEGTRELLENVPYAPASGRYKVYLIDEVHMFSTASFNALLKTLEEPPEHVKFLLATTDPQKVPVTVLSRCLQFNLKRMAAGALTDYLAKILQDENIDYEIPALDLIARAAEGSVRDALSLVEQSVAFGNGAVRAAEVESMLGRVSIDRLITLIDTLASGDMPALFAQVESMAEYSPDYHDLMGEILSILHRIALLQSVNDSVSETHPGREQLVRLADSIDADALQLFYQIGLHARRDMPLAPDPREAFDMALLRMHAFKPQETTDADFTSSAGAVSNRLPTDPVSGQKIQSADVQAEKSGRLPIRGEVSAGGSTPVLAAKVNVPESAPGIDDPRGPLTEKPMAVPVSPEKSGADEKTGNPDEEISDTTIAAKGSAGTQAQGGVSAEFAQPDASSDHAGESTDKSFSPEDWPHVVDKLDIAGMPLQLANNCSLVEVTDSTVGFKLERSSEHLNTPRFQEREQTALSAWLGRSIKNQVEIVDSDVVTPAKLDAKKQADALAAAHVSIHEDPIVQQLIDKVDGAVDESSVRPLSGS